MHYPRSHLFARLRRTLSVGVLIALLTAFFRPSTLAQSEQRIESDDPQVQAAGTWTSQHTAAASGGSYRYSSGTEADVLTFDFSGPSIEVVYVAGPSLGTLAIEVDGTVLRTVITTADQTAYGQSTRVDYLTNETHQLKVYAQAGGVVGVDAFVIPPASTAADTLLAAAEDSDPARAEPRNCDPANVVHLVSRASGVNGAIADQGSEFQALSHDGRFVAFASDAENLVPEINNESNQVYVRDRNTCTTVLISAATSGIPNGDANMPSISATGRYVAFVSDSSNLTSGVPNTFTSHVYVRDRDTDTDGIFDESGAVNTILVDRSTSGVLGDSSSYAPVITPDGRYVAFTSYASNLVSGDSNGVRDVFVRDLQTNQMIRASVANANSGQANNQSGQLVSVFYINGLDISDNGRFIVFESDASNLVTGDTNNRTDIFVRDRDSDNDGVFDEPVSQTTTRVSVSGSGAQGNGFSYEAAISGDGQIIAFLSTSNNLVMGDTAVCEGFNCVDVFVYNQQNAQTTRVSIGPGGVQANGQSSSTSLSSDGRFVGFMSFANNLVGGGTDNSCGTPPNDSVCLQGFVHDRSSGTTAIVTTTANGEVADNGVRSLTISGDGEFVAFSSFSSNLAGGNGFDSHVYVAPNNAGPAPDTIAVFRPDLEAVTFINTLQDLPPLASYSTFVMNPPIPEGVQGQWVLGDWNGDLLKTPGVYVNGMFVFTNFLGVSESWTSVWIGIDGPPVAGHFSPSAINDCIGAVDDAPLPPFGTVFSLYFTCNLTSGLTPPIAFQWLSAVLPDSQGFSGQHQFVAGDWNLDLVESIGVRRGEFIAFTNVAPSTLVPGQTYSAAEFNLAQYWGVPPNTNGDYGILVAGDWDSDFDDSFGVFYQNGHFYRRRDVEWNTGEYLLQRIGQPLGTPVTAGSWH